jgi:hypothetical protein
MDANEMQIIQRFSAVIKPEVPGSIPGATRFSEHQ